MRLLRQNILKKLALSKIRLEKVQILAGLRTENHTLHSMKVMYYITHCGTHVC